MTGVQTCALPISIAAAALHTVSTLIVIFNSARLVRTGEDLTSDNSGAAVQSASGGEE